MSSILDDILGRKNGPEPEEETAPYIPDNVPEEWADFEPDPQPGPEQPGSRRKAPAPRPAPGAITAPMRRRISAELEAYALLAAMPLQLRDPVCGQVAVEVAKPTADAIADILAHYPDLAAKFLATGVLGGWIKLVMALKPLVEVVYHHHLAKDHPALDTGGEGEDDGTVSPAYRPGQ